MSIWRRASARHWRISPAGCSSLSFSPACDEANGKHHIQVVALGRAPRRSFGYACAALRSRAYCLHRLARPRKRNPERSSGLPSASPRPTTRPTESTASRSLRSVGLLGVALATPAQPSGRAPTVCTAWRGLANATRREAQACLLLLPGLRRGTPKPSIPTPRPSTSHRRGRRTSRSAGG